MRVVLLLVLRRARNRPARWLLTAFGIAGATAYGGAILAEATVAGDGAARAVLRALPASERVVRIATSNVVTPALERAARSGLLRLGLPSQTEVVLLNPVRLGATVVRPAAIEPLSRWARPDLPARCLLHTCPVLALGVTHPRKLSIPGFRMPVVGRAQLNSSAPLGFAPGTQSRAGQAPVLLTGDPAGLERASPLNGIFRTHSWFSLLSGDELHAWQLAALQSRLLRAQSDLALTGGLSLSAPFSAVATARRQAQGAPGLLLLAGGGAIAVLALFLTLTAGAIRQDQRAELERLRAAGALTSTLVSFVVSEAAFVCAIGVLTGGAAAIGIAGLLADGAGLPVGAVLAHSLIGSAGLAALASGWLGATALVTLLLTQRGSGLADAAALAAVAALALALSNGGGSDSLGILLAPLACLAAGVLVARAGASLLQLGERAARAGPVLPRLAFVGLARSPLAPSLAIAFLAVSTAVGGFALEYRATLLRSAADQAADRVPLDALVSAGPDFTTPLRLAPLARWRSLSSGAAFPIRRTEATYAAGAGSATVPALGVPAAALPGLHGWRAGDAPASLTQISRAMTPPGPTRVPGPALPAATRELVARIRAPGLGLDLIADLRGPDGTVNQRQLVATGVHGWARAAVPRGRWELQALELHEPTGLEITAGHQNGENLAAATQSSTTVAISAVQARDRAGHRLLKIDLRRWRALGAATGLESRAGGAQLLFVTTGAAGLLRPAQPTDLRPLPVLVDPATAAAADAGGRLALTIDGAPVAARAVAVLRRFPTVPPGAGGFVVADQAELAGALDAWLPGQGSPDELWLSSKRPLALKAALLSRPFSQLTSSERIDVERSLRNAGVARAVLGALLAAAGLAALLALIGLAVSLLGSAEERRVVDDLVGQGVGPRALRAELLLRSLFTSVAGCLAGLALALALTRLAVGAVHSAAQIADPVPPLVTVTPWTQLALWGLIVFGASLVAAALAMLGRAHIGRLR